MAFTHNKLRPIVVKAITEYSPEAEKSVAFTTIVLLERRMEQLDAIINAAEMEKYRIRKLRKNLLDHFPESDDS